MPHGIVHVASEVVGFAKTGGLADVAGSLPRALARRGHACTVFMPLYHGVRTGKVRLAATKHEFRIPVGNREVNGRLWRTSLPDTDIPVYLVEQSDYFERDDPSKGHGLYQYTLPGGEKRDYLDNCERFVFFCRAVLESLQLLNLWPAILHGHDWQTGLVPVYLNEIFRKQGAPDLREKYQRIRTVFTIHNIAYQGQFRPSELVTTGLDWRLFNYLQLEFYGHLNLLKAGIVFSDWLTTVSPRYAEEIQTPYYGNGLQGVLAERRDRLSGIVNGVDYQVWNPASDALLPATYTADTVGQGKATCKARVQERYGLEARPRTPLLGMVARLVEQKGIELLVKSVDSLLSRRDVQLVILGEGEPFYHRLLLDIRDRYPRQVGLTLGFDERLAHQIEAGCDIFLMPSLFEPSGLNQLYSLKYGAVPVVRATGGLADTIKDCNPHALADGSATGFSFQAYAADAFQDAVQRALAMYNNQPEQWLQLIRNGMGQDWSWDRSAAEYEKVYDRLAGH